MSFAPSYDPNCAAMMPSPNRGKRNPRFSSPRQQFSPGGEQHSFQQSPYNNRGFRTPNRQSRGRGRGRGCQYGGYQRDAQQFSPNYRSMSGSYEGSSPNCSFDSNLKRRLYSGKGLYHPSMLNDPWEGLSTEGKPMFRAANYISESFLSYCAKLQSKAREKTAEDDGKISSYATNPSSISQLAANVSKLYDSFVSSSSQNIPGNIQKQTKDVRPTKIQKTESSSETGSEKAETTSESANAGDGDNKVTEDDGRDDKFSDSDDGNMMF